MNKLTLTPLGTVAPYPKDNKNCPGFLIEYMGEKILLDCGNGCMSLMDAQKDLNNLKVFISHLHPDHYGDLPALMQAALVYRRHGLLDEDIEVYIPNTDYTYENDYDPYEIWPEIRKREHIIDYTLLKTLASTCPIKFHGYSSINLLYNDIKITTLEVPHEIHSYAIKIETKAGSIVYSSDTGTKNNLRKFAKDCDILICESTFLKGQLREKDWHLFAQDAAKIAKDANVSKLLLTHFWPEIDKEEYVKEAKEIFENTEAAIEGKQLILRR